VGKRGKVGALTWSGGGRPLSGWRSLVQQALLRDARIKRGEREEVIYQGNGGDSRRRPGSKILNNDEQGCLKARGMGVDSTSNNSPRRKRGKEYRINQCMGTEPQLRKKKWT